MSKFTFSEKPSKIQLISNELKQFITEKKYVMKLSDFKTKPSNYDLKKLEEILEPLGS